MTIRPSKTNFAVFVTIVGAVACIASVRAALPEQSFNIYWENDGTFIKPYLSTDRHYTDGLKLVYTHQPDSNLLREFGRWNNFGQNGSDVTTAMGYFIGHNMYTPDHADAPEKRSDHDRIFAGWLYGGIFAQRATMDQMEHFELNLGIIGPSAHGGDIQNFIHHLVNQGESNGWEDQLGDEFAIDFTWFKRQRADSLLGVRTSNFDSHIEYGFTGGSVHRSANLGLVFRWGYNLPNDFGPGRLEMPGSACGRTADDKSSLYLFTRVGGKLVQYDRFLSGLDEEPVVGQLQLGVVWRHKAFQLSYSQTFLTREYREQSGTDSYGALNLTYYF